MNQVPPVVCSKAMEKQYIKLGYGECIDCIWYHTPEGCNVEKGSYICSLNCKLRRIIYAKEDV
jgi:hypothetical protein